MINLGFEAFMLFFCCSMFVASFVVYMLVQTLLNQPPFVPSRLKNIIKAFEYIDLGPDHNFVDLGSGDGRVVFAARRFGARATGIEINPYLVVYCRIFKCIFRREVKFFCGSYFRKDLSQYNVVFTYLYPDVVEKLEQKIFTEIPTGSYVITNTFNFINYQPEQVFGNVYIYRKD